MDTYIVYFDETGDDGANTSSSKEFVLTGMYMNADTWQDNFNKLKTCRRELKNKYGLHMSQEIHTKHLVRDKGMYRDYQWTDEQRRNLLIDYIKCIASLDMKVVNVIINKEKIINEDYNVLETALKYNIQRIENDSEGKWHYLIITDEGRLAPMRKIARAIRSYNPIPSYAGVSNKPIGGLIEDIMAKDSAESYFIQTCDFISFFVDLYFRAIDKSEELPGRVEKVINKEFIQKTIVTFEHGKILNLKASGNHKHGFVIYPK